MQRKQEYISLTTAARRVGWSYHRAWSRSMSGLFGQLEERDGRLFVPAEGVRSFIAKRDTEDKVATG